MAKPTKLNTVVNFPVITPEVVRAAEELFKQPDGTAAHLLGGVVLLEWIPILLEMPKQLEKIGDQLNLAEQIRGERN